MASHAALASVISEYATIERLPTSTGERRVAYALVDRLRRLGCAADVEPVPATSSYALPIGLLSATGVAAGLMAGRGARLAGTVAAGLAAAAIADDVAGGRRPVPPARLPRRTAYHLVGRARHPPPQPTG